MKFVFYVGVVVIVLLVGVVFVGGYLVFLVGEGFFSWDSYIIYFEGVLDLFGQFVIIFGFWLVLEDGFFDNMIVYFEVVIGVDVIYVGFDSFEQ